MAIVKKLKQHPPLPPSRYEVGIYCRVSTASKTQVVSAGHQLSGLIADVANSQQARLYDVYLDIQSGRTSDNRKNLMRLLDDCRAGRVTLVYTKSISRFARNTVDVLTIVRELKKMNVPVYFENEQLYSFDKQAERYPTALQKGLTEFFMFEAGFSLMFAENNIDKDDVSYVCGHCFRSISSLNQVLFAINKEYCINEKKAVKMIEDFKIKPSDYKERVDKVISLISTDVDCTRKGIEILQRLVNEVEYLKGVHIQ